MKLVIAYINPFKLDEVRDALKETGVTGLSAGNVQGFGRQAGHTETYRGSEYEVEMVPKVRPFSWIRHADPPNSAACLRS